MNNLATQPVRLYTQKSVSLHSAALSKQGKTRETNQDSVFHWTGTTELGHSLALVMVCDGLGGHAAGDKASKLAVETISSDLMSILQSAGSHAINELNGPQAEEMAEWVEAAIQRANRQIYNYAHSHRDAPNLGTTVTLVAIFDHLAQVANVGDSRTYHWLAPELTQLTRDHSYVAELVQNGLIAPEEAANHPKGNILLRALGTDATVEVDLVSLEVRTGDKLLLCSDGFWKAFPDSDELTQRFSEAGSAVDLCKVLAAESYNRSGTDDTSLAVVTID